MEETNLNRNSRSPKENLFGVATLFLLVGTIFLGTLFIKELKPKANDNLSTISVSGSGEVYAVPDVAVITFSVRESAKTSKEATSKMSEKEAKALEFLNEKKIDKKDIKTLWFSTNPKYEYVKDLICSSNFCPSGRQEIVGYESSETIQVKIRDTEIIGDIFDGLTSVGVGEVNGPDFSVDNPDALKEEARRMAITDAKEKAEILRKDLGVRLVRIVSYSEDGDYPMYYGMGGDAMTMNVKAESAPSAPNISTGEQKIISNITIIYEIR